MRRPNLKAAMRERVRDHLADLIMKEHFLDEIRQTKEGLVLSLREGDVVIRVVLKKERVEAQDVIDTIKRDREKKTWRDVVIWGKRVEEKGDW